MRLRLLLLIALLAASTVSPAAAQPPASRTWDERTIALPDVGRAAVYVPRAQAAHVVLLISGDAGWTSTMADLARHIAAQDAVVVGVAYATMQRKAARVGGCWYVASDLEFISHAAQKALALPQYHPPLLVGVQAGASLVYAALANTPATTFTGAISLGFCPRLTTGVEICSGETWTPDYDYKTRVADLPPTRTLPHDWYILQGTADRVCPIDRTRRFVAEMPHAHLATIDRAAHAPTLLAQWTPALDTALHDLWTEKETKPPTSQPRTATTRELEDELQRLQLPLEFRWPAQTSGLLLFFSGDGGWASLDEETSEHLVAQGIGVVGVSSLRYFWNAKPPVQVAADMKRLVGVMQRSGRPVFAGGFSFGSEIVPVALKEWTAAERRQIAGLVLIAPSPSASFEIDPLDWVRAPTQNSATMVAPAVRADLVPTLCLAGSEEEDTPCPSLAGAPGVRVVRLPGSHHFNSDYAAVADVVLQFIRGASAEKRP